MAFSIETDNNKHTKNILIRKAIFMVGGAIALTASCSNSHDMWNKLDTALDNNYPPTIEPSKLSEAYRRVNVQITEYNNLRSGGEHAQRIHSKADPEQLLQAYRIVLNDHNRLSERQVLMDNTRVYQGGRIALNQFLSLSGLVMVFVPLVTSMYSTRTKQNS